MKLKKRIDIRICIYSILFFLIMFIDQRTLTAMNYARMAFVQATILPFLILMVMQMSFDKIKQKKYVIYAIASFLVFVFGAIYLYHSSEAYLKYTILLLEILIFGFIVIYAILNRKQYLKKETIICWQSVLWILLLFLMCISKYNGLWIWIVLIMFTSLIFLNISKEEQERIFLGILYGIISSYFLIQGYAFAFRPYDMRRYYGAFGNPNINALFYDIIFVAFLINAFRLGEKKWSQVVNMIFASSAIGFTVLTGSKIGILTEVGVAFLYFIIKVFRKGVRMKKIFVHLILWIMTTIFLLPICYFTARYTPPLFHHPVWFYTEYSPDRVHSFDPYNSEKYPEKERVANLLLERYFGIQDVFEVPETTIISPKEADDLNENVVILPIKKTEEGESLEEALTFERKVGLNTYTARLYIWKEFIIRFNLFGHVMVETHAHNVFIEFIYYFGIIAGGLFFLGYTVSWVYQCFLTYKSRKFIDFGILSFLTIFGLYGMAELDWFRGQASLTLFFFMICFIIWRKRTKNDILLKGDYKSENKNS